MDEVFILGSGFSKAIDTRMPTLRELSTEVVEAMGDAWLPEWGDDLRENVELLLTYLGGENPWERSGEHYYQRGMFHDVQDAVVAMLRDVQSDVLGDTDAPPHWLDRLVRYWHTQKATVITFNYDVLVEQAFTEIRDGDGTGMRRHPSELFCIPVADALSRSGRGGKGGLPDRGATFDLLKLHGSLAWFYSGPGAPPGDVVYSTDRVGWHARPPGDLRNVVDKEPLMVPPLLQKTPYYANDVLREQWRQARRAIEHADRVTCIGYSLPPTDLTVRFLLSTATPDLCVDVVDLEATRVARHLRDILPDFHIAERSEGATAVESWVAMLT